jgi:hypothetical protein
MAEAVLSKFDEQPDFDESFTVGITLLCQSRSEI